MTTLSQLISIYKWISSDRWNSVSLELNEDYSLCAPNLHDSKFLGLLNLSKNQYILFLLLENRINHVAIVLSDVTLLKADNFREGNIVLDVCIYTGTSQDAVDLRDELEDLYGLREIKVDKTKEKLQAALKQEADKIAAGDLALITINPSYGCSLIALSKTIEIFLYEN